MRECTENGVLRRQLNPCSPSSQVGDAFFTSPLSATCSPSNMTSRKAAACDPVVIETPVRGPPRSAACPSSRHHRLMLPCSILLSDSYMKYAARRSSSTPSGAPTLANMMDKRSLQRDKRERVFQKRGEGKNRGEFEKFGISKDSGLRKGLQ